MHVFNVCAYMDTYVCVWLEKKEGYVYTCVISYLLLKYRCLCGKQIVKHLLYKSSGSGEHFIHLYHFPCWVGHSTSRISILVCVSEDPNIFSNHRKECCPPEESKRLWIRTHGLVVFFCLFCGLGQLLALFCASV